MKQQYPKVGEVKINDKFWTQYIDSIRRVSLPYALKKMEEADYVANFSSVIEKNGKQHIGPPFSDGLLFETLRGACDFLASEHDVVLEAYVDKIIELVASAQDKDGFICTKTMLNYPDKRWGDNGGDIVMQHDLYDHGCLIEAAISHYKATGKTKFLDVAVKAANLIVATLGRPPKKNIIPGHSLPEEAFVKLYRLFRDEPALRERYSAQGVCYEDYLDMAEFWYDARGDHNGRYLAKEYQPYYNQDHVTFSKQTEAVGHSVRAMLCYLGATAVAIEKGREDYMKVVDVLWNNVVNKKLHISGGIGARRDIEGFDEDYNLPNKAYLETCAAIGLAFWNTEMNLVFQNSKYFDCFERSLYNNILSAIGNDFKHFFYENPLESDGDLRRWEWHGCPCCPPMIFKIFSSLNSFIYSYDENSVNVNMFIGSCYENDVFKICQSDSVITLDSKGKLLKLKIRIPEYVDDFRLLQNGHSLEHSCENGYAVVEAVWDEKNPLTVQYNLNIKRNVCNQKVTENHGKVAVSYGPFIMCAEGADNNGNVDIEISEQPCFTLCDENVVGNASNGTKFCLIPYYKWCNRINKPNDAKMRVWLRQENMKSKDVLSDMIGDKLYAIYE